MAQVERPTCPHEISYSHVTHPTVARSSTSWTTPLPTAACTSEVRSTSSCQTTAHRRGTGRRSLAYCSSSPSRRALGLAVVGGAVERPPRHSTLVARPAPTAWRTELEERRSCRRSRRRYQDVCVRPKKKNVPYSPSTRTPRSTAARAHLRAVIPAAPTIANAASPGEEKGEGAQRPSSDQRGDSVGRHAEEDGLAGGSVVLRRCHCE